MSIQKITILPRREVERAIQTPYRLSESNWALISIWSASELIYFMTYPILKKIGCDHALSLRFADLTPKEYTMIESESKLFEKEDARLIIAFIDKIHKLDVPELIIHCAAGISRSGAVGLWACRYLKLNEREFRKQNEHILPNIHVLSILNEVSGINDEYMKFWVSKEMKEKRAHMVNLVTDLF